MCIGSVIDTFETNAQTANEAACILSKCKNRLEEVGLEVNRKAIALVSIQQQRTQPVIVGSIRSYGRLYAAGVIEQKGVPEVWKR